MNRNVGGSKEWIIFAAVSVVLAIICVMFGVNLLPTMAQAQERSGTIAPFLLIWGMIGMTVAAALGLAVFLIVSGSKQRF